MGKIDLMGETMNLQSGPNTQEYGGFGGGTIQDAETGRVDLGRSASPLGVFSDQSQGTIENENTGTVPLNRKAHRGYEAGTQLNQEDLINP